MARRNTGSIHKKREGVFQIAVDLSSINKWWLATNGSGSIDVEALVLTRESGGRRRRYETVEGTREDAERRLHELQYEADTGTLPKGKVTLNVWLDYWLREYVAVELRPSTIEDYRMQVKNYLSPLLGLHVPPRHQGAPYPGVSEPPRRRVGSSVVRKLRQVLSGALREAVNNDIIPTNPVRKTPHPQSGAAEGDRARARAGPAASR